MRIKTALLFAAAPFAVAATPAFAAPGDPIALGDDATLDIQANVRLRYEAVDQDNAVDDADALTIRGRLGVELAISGFKLFAEGEATGALADDYNDTLPFNGVEPFSVVADPENFELNRLQLSYFKNGNGVTVGRQRIILDNARFVGNVGWRQNEQTFDAVRGQAKIGPVSLDATYSNSQRTIFGVDSPREAMDGDLVLLNGGIDTKIVDVKAFAYLLDYDAGQAFNSLPFSSQTYGFLAKADIPLGVAKLNLLASAATQQDLGANPTSYSTEYFNFEAGVGVSGFTLKAGYEELGSDGGVASFQTPLATLHAFNGWADVFLVTPATGLRDTYASVAKGFTIPGLTTFNAMVAYHQFDSDFGGIDYGSEFDAQVGFKVGPVGLLAKFASYNADSFSVDTDKFWLQAEYSF